jgi:hypothetical protein
MSSESLKDAIRLARIESAARSSVVVDLRDAEVARLEMLNEALDPLFAEIPSHIDLFDRGISGGDTPRLWIDVVAHVVMGRDKRLYRFVQDGRYGRKTLAESTEIGEMVAAITHYVASRIVERERALDDGHEPVAPSKTQFVRRTVVTEEPVKKEYIVRTKAASDSRPADEPEQATAKDAELSEQRWRMLRMFLYGLIVGVLALFTALWIAASRAG